MSWAEDASSAPALIDLGTTLTVHRFCAFSGVPPLAGLCASGQDADAVTLGTSQPEGFLSCPGLPVQVESGAAFASGATLQSDASGRAITWASGAKVARALEAATGAGQVKLGRVPERALS